MDRFGRLRQQWEKRYRDPKDVLIEAERLKKKLRKALARAAREATMPEPARPTLKTCLTLLRWHIHAMLYRLIRRWL